MSANVNKSFLRRFADDESGISAIEYGFLAAGIAIVIWAAIGGDDGIRSSLTSIFGEMKADLADAAPAAPGG